MSLNPPHVRPAPSETDPRLAEFVDELTARLKAGEILDLEPAPAAVLRVRGRLAAITTHLAAAGRPVELRVPKLGIGGPDLRSGGTAGGLLGDFRSLPEIGRGGMGIVYEAEQVSLGRRVALKVLPFAATMDPRQFAAFPERSAGGGVSAPHQHCAGLFVGSERGVHFYAMQFIEGRDLAS